MSRSRLRRKRHQDTHTHTGRDHKQKCKGRKFTQSQFLSLNSEERQRENVCKYESIKRKKKKCITNKRGEEVEMHVGKDEETLYV